MGEHFYRVSDGSRVYEIEGQNGERRPPTLRDAKNGLRGKMAAYEIVPSVTAIIKAAGEPPGLVSWKLRTALMRAAMNPRREDETPELYFARLATVAAEQESAADLGTRIHGAIAFYLQRKSLPPDVGDLAPILQPAVEWLDTNVAEVLAVEQSFATPVYGGTLDFYARLRDGTVAYMDFKSQAMRGSPRVYDEWGEQLCAYAEGHNQPHNALMNLVINARTPGVYRYTWEPREVRRMRRMWHHTLGHFQLAKHWWPR